MPPATPPVAIATSPARQFCEIIEHATLLLGELCVELAEEAEAALEVVVVPEQEERADEEQTRIGWPVPARITVW